MKRTDSRKRNPNLWRIGIPVLLSVVVVVLAGLLAWSLISHNGPSKDSSAPTAQQSTSSAPQKVTRSLSGLSADQDRKNALAAAQNILNIASVSPKAPNDAKSRVAALENGDTSVISTKLPSTIRFVDAFASDDILKSSTYSSLIAMSSYLGDAGKIKPVSDTAYHDVFVDTEAGIAQVPLAAFTESSAPLALEMVYADGGWKLSPYSLLTSVKLSAMLTGSTGTATAAPTAPATK